jgi:chaperonin GroES
MAGINRSGSPDDSPGPTLSGHQKQQQFNISEDITMKIRPLYDRIVLTRVKEEETSRNGIIIPDSAKEKPQEGLVIAVGRGKRLEDGAVVALDVKAGDRVLFGKYSGSEITLDGSEYIIMREDDVLGIFAS